MGPPLGGHHNHHHHQARNNPRNLLFTLATTLLLPFSASIAQARQQSQPPQDSRYNADNINSDNRNNAAAVVEGSKHINHNAQQHQVATLAPALAVRAPAYRQSNRPVSSAVGASTGLDSPQSARSLNDWEVEDFLLVATVDGTLYGTERKTGKMLWSINAERPMVQTTHYPPPNGSQYGEDSIFGFVWSIEPRGDGPIYIWAPGQGGGLARTGMSMKALVEELAPFAQEDGNPPVVYTGQKTTDMLTVDASNGHVLKWFGHDGDVHVDNESCKYQTSFDAECNSRGTFTLGRNQYTVSVHSRDGYRVAKIVYSEWVLNQADRDLTAQYAIPTDAFYVSGRHDGAVYGFLHANPASEPVFSQKLESPMATVYDVYRPKDTVDTKPELLVMQQPVPTASYPDLASRRARDNLVFLNQTVGGGWFALPAAAYPLIMEAPEAKITIPELWQAQPWKHMTYDRLYQTLIGTHSLMGIDLMDVPTLPGPDPDDDNLVSHGDSDTHRHDEVVLEIATRKPDPLTTLFENVGAFVDLLQDSILNLITNPFVIFALFWALWNYHDKLLAFSKRGFQGLLALQADKLSTDHVPKHILPPCQDGYSEPVVGDFASNGVKDDAVDPAIADDSASSDSLSTPGRTTSKKTPDTPDGKSEAVVEAPSQEAPTKVDVKQAQPVGKAMPKNEDMSTDKTDNSGGEKSLSPTIKFTDDTVASPAEPAKRKARRGKRGGVKHRKGPKREGSEPRVVVPTVATSGSGSGPDVGTNQSKGEDPMMTVEQVVSAAQKMGGQPKQVVQQDLQTIHGNLEGLDGAVVSLGGSFEVDEGKQLGTGSNGTVVFAGKFDGRNVAVKRMLIQFFDIASQETKLLRESDDHRNVIRYYAQRSIGPFLYIALELCQASLADVVERPITYPDLAEVGRGKIQYVLCQIAEGLRYLHDLRIVHRDLKPHNILVNLDRDGQPRVVVSDFGLCKKLEGGQSSFGATTAHAAGTSGWRAPELLMDDDAASSINMDSVHSGSSLIGGEMLPSRRVTRAIDIFSLGLVYYYVLTGGQHPFDCGDRYMREVNIRKGNYDLSGLEAYGEISEEAKQLVGSMLQAEHKMRPTARDVLAHPFFWTPKKRLDFLCDVSDHFEKEPRDPPSEALGTLEFKSTLVIRNGDFLRLLPKEFVDSLGKQRKYTGSRMLDLLRAIRNKRNHYEDLSDSLKKMMGGFPDGYLLFWTSRFPTLLITCWQVIFELSLDDTARFKEYYQPIRAISLQ